VRVRTLSCALLAIVLTFVAAPARAASGDVKVLLPDDDNLQYMSFWVAKAAGYFADEGLEVSITFPKTPAETRGLFERGETNVAVLPPPMYLELVAARFPLVLVCNLLRNDPINLIVQEKVWNERKLSRDVPVAERLRAIAGLRVGVAPNPPSRLRALFAAYGMDADRDIQMKIFHGYEQNDAFARGDVDVLFAHTPYVERALVDQGAKLLVHISGGEVPPLAMRQVHALVFTKALAEGSPSTALAMTRAIARAEKLVHADRAKTAELLSREFPKRDPRHVRAIVDLYEPAIPDSPDVTSAGMLPALALFPASRPAPSLAGIDLEAYVAPSFAQEAAKPPASRLRWLLFAIAGLALLFVYARRRRVRAGTTTQL
jgi:ABC-type nitrate/sulfonate/bicarbonate transport system substrate-binding protein